MWVDEEGGHRFAGSEIRQRWTFRHEGPSGEAAMTTTSIEWIKKHGSTAGGKREFIAFLRGKALTMKESILANCYQCTGFYLDGQEGLRR